MAARIFLLELNYNILKLSGAPSELPRPQESHYQRVAEQRVQDS